jgi:hypothetical protein
MSNPQPIKKQTIKEFFTKYDAVSSRGTLCCMVIKHHNNTTNLHNHMKRKHGTFQANNNKDQNQKRLKLQTPQTDGVDFSSHTNTLVQNWWAYGSWTTLPEFSILGPTNRHSNKTAP